MRPLGERGISKISGTRDKNEREGVILRKKKELSSWETGGTDPWEKEAELGFHQEVQGMSPSLGGSCNREGLGFFCALIRIEIVAETKVPFSSN